jgi:thiamine biosynthesis lipoprotein
MLRRYPFAAMGSPCELRLYGSDPSHLDEVSRKGVTEVTRLEHKYSRYRDDSLASLINRSAGDPKGVTVDEETANLLDYAQTCYEQSGGLFDITSGILRRVWNFKSRRVPSQAEIDRVRQNIGWDKVRWARPRIVLPLRGMELDFGGYVKEYTADRVADLCRFHGVRHGLVDLGGDMAVIGPHPDGHPWVIGIRHPRKTDRAMARIPLNGAGLASSGDYERCMIVDGQRYGHILNPKTGWPVNGLLCVSVVAPHCLVAGTASTIAMLKGADEGPRWLDQLGLPNVRMDQNAALTGTLS